MNEILTIGFLENMKILFVGILLYALIFGILKKVQVFDDDKINAVIALVAVIIVSFSGVVTYAITYAINWFVILLFLIFLIFILMLFMEIKPSDVINKSQGKIILAILIILFSIILVKSFFALNNTFDTTNPINDSYQVNTSYNVGLNDVPEAEKAESFFSKIINWENYNSDMLAAAFFLIIIGIFVWVIGR